MKKSFLLLFVLALFSQIGSAATIKYVMYDWNIGSDSIFPPFDYGYAQVDGHADFLIRIDPSTSGLTTPVTFSCVVTGDAEHFKITEPSGSGTTSVIYQIRYFPLSAGEHTMTVTIKNGTTDSSEPIILRGSSAKRVIEYAGTWGIGIKYKPTDYQKSVTKAQIALTGNLVNPRIEGADSKHFSIVADATNADSVTVAFIPIDIPLRKFDAQLIISSSEAGEADVVVPITVGGSFKKPLPSTADNTIWYYVKFVSTGKVIQDNGNDQPLTAETLVEGKEEQLWKVTVIHTDFDFFNYGSKKHPDSRIHFNKSYSVLDNIYYLTANPVNSNVSDKIWYWDYPQQEITNYTAIVPENSFLPRKDFAMRPEDDNAGARLVASKLVGDVDLSKILLDFIPLDASNGIKDLSASKIKVYPNPADEYVYVELSKDAVAVSVVSLTGQILTTVKPGEAIEKIPVSNLGSGIYFLTIKKASGMETVKFIKK
jgi:hypothetical protein